MNGVFFSLQSEIGSGQGRIRTSEGVSQLIYSQPPLSTWVPAHLLSEPTAGIEPATTRLQGGRSAD
jgi:hypothetical protein